MTRRRTGKSKWMLCLTMALFLMFGSLHFVFAEEGLTVAQEDIYAEAAETTDKADSTYELESEPKLESRVEPVTQPEADTDSIMEPCTQPEAVTESSVETGAQPRIETESSVEPDTQAKAETVMAVPGTDEGGFVSTVTDDNASFLPRPITSQNEFVIDENTDPLTANNEDTELDENEAIENTNANMRLSIGSRASVTIDDIWAKKVNESIDIDGQKWYVVKKEQNYNSSGVNYVLLIRQAGDLVQFNPTGNNSNDYSNSNLRTHLNKEYDSYATSTIKQIAVVPSLSLSSPSSKSVFSLPTATPAGSQSKGRDIFFALSYADMYEVNGNSLAIAPLFNNLPLWVWSRTAATSTGTGNLWGVKRAAGTMDGGLSPASTNVYANPAVWVRTTPLSYDITVHYIDTNGVSIGSPSSATYTVAHGDPFTLDPSLIPVISDYQYIQWKVGSSGQLQDNNTPVYLASVLAETDIYLIYDQVPNTTSLTISKMVEGPMANETTAFKFTVSIFDNSGTALAGAEFEYEITNVNNVTMQTGTLQLDNSGEWTFSLKHGERIIINGVSPDGYIQVVEEQNAYYEASYIDSEDLTSTKVVDKDTTMLAMTEAPRTIDFTNERIYVPETGIADPDTMPYVMMPIATTLLLAAKTILRRRKGSSRLA
jgi:hypothetical protein